MRRRKHKGFNGKMTLIYMSMILSLGAMGVGYAAWNDGLNIDFSITTGETFTTIFSKKGDEVLILDDGELILTLSDDRQTLYIEGEVYPSFNEDLNIKMYDEGSIPTELKKFEVIKNEDIAELTNSNDSNKKNVNKRMSNFSTNTLNTDNSIENFEISISPEEVDVETESMSGSFKTMSLLSFESSEIENLKSEIESLKHEINAYNQERDYEFEYYFLFEQSL